MFITVKDFFDETEHMINSRHIVRITDEAENYSVIELDDCDGTFIRIDKNTYNLLKKYIKRIGK